MSIAPWDAKRYQKALVEIRDVASAGATVDGLSRIAQIAEGALADRAPFDDCHKFIPHPKWPWFCKACGYAPYEPLKHFQDGGDE